MHCLLSGRQPTQFHSLLGSLQGKSRLILFWCLHIQNFEPYTIFSPTQKCANCRNNIGLVLLQRSCISSAINWNSFLRKFLEQKKRNVHTNSICNNVNNTFKDFKIFAIQFDVKYYVHFSIKENISGLHLHLHIRLLMVRRMCKLLHLLCKCIYLCYI